MVGTEAVCGGLIAHIPTFSPKTLTTNVTNQDYDYTVNVIFSNDDDDDVQMLGNFSVENPNGPS